MSIFHVRERVRKETWRHQASCQQDQHRGRADKIARAVAVEPTIAGGVAVELTRSLELSWLSRQDRAGADAIDLTRLPKMSPSSRQDLQSCQGRADKIGKSVEVEPTRSLVLSR
jgi:hypothetical protein